MLIAVVNSLQYTQYFWEDPKQTPLAAPQNLEESNSANILPRQALIELIFVDSVSLKYAATGVRLQRVISALSNQQGERWQIY